MTRPIETPVQGQDALRAWFMDSTKAEKDKVPSLMVVTPV